MHYLFFGVSTVLLIIFIIRYMKEMFDRKTRGINLIFLLTAVVLIIVGTIQLQRLAGGQETEKSLEIEEKNKQITTLKSQKVQVETEMEAIIEKQKLEISKLEETKKTEVDTAINEAKAELDKEYQSDLEAAVGEAIAKVTVEFESKIAEAEAEAAVSYEDDTEEESVAGLEYDPFGADLNCPDFSSQAAAQAVYEAAGGPSEDPHDLDRDNDGMACDTN